MELTARDERFRTYFTALAADYAHLTSNTTRMMAAAALDFIDLPTGTGILIHDNASGPGTATSAILERYKAANLAAPSIVATDYTPAMIDALNTARNSNEAVSWESVQAQVQDSQALDFSSDTFDLSFCNVSIANFGKPLLALQEMYRTLKPGGTAVVTNWKLFGTANLIAAARTRLRGGEAAKAPAIAGPEFMQERHIAETMQQAGWSGSAITTHAVKFVASDDDDLEGALRFLTDGYRQSATDKATWEKVAKETIEDVKSREGGIVCEGWVVVAVK